jgi:F-type H+-transporting ATPase subunit delta
VVQKAIARRYAKALFGLLQPSEIQPAKDGLQALAGAYAESREFRNFLLNPIFPREQKTSVIRELAAKSGLPPMAERFLSHTVKKNRIRQICEISEAFAELADRVSNRTVVELRSARELSDETRAAIRTRLEQATGGAIDIMTEVDPSLLGGLRIRIGSFVYDGSLRGQLDRLRTVLTRDAPVFTEEARSSAHAN